MKSFFQVLVQLKKYKCEKRVTIIIVCFFIIIIQTSLFSNIFGLFYSSLYYFIANSI